MAWIILALRRSELQSSISQHTYEKLQLSRQKRKLSNFCAAAGDGKITPSEIASLGTELFGTGLDLMGYSSLAASEVAQLQTDTYATAYESLTQEQYYNNPSIAAEAQLYYKDGQLDTATMYAKFYEQALQEYVQQEIEPLLKEKEEEMEEKMLELETLVESEEAELEQLKNSISQHIQSETIKLS